MRRAMPGAFLLFLAAAPLRAQEAPPTVVRPETFQAEADRLRDAVASPVVGDAAVRGEAAAFFADVPSRTPSFRPARWAPEQEPVDGRVGTVEGMLDEAQKRWDRYKLTATEVPDARLAAAIDYAKAMQKGKNVALDASMPEFQIAESNFPKSAGEEGAIKLNALLPLMATRMGEAFAYAPFVHEAAHARAHFEGRLDPARTIDNEIEAYRVQCLWLDVIDPKAERMYILKGNLELYLKRHPEDKIARLTAAYLGHMFELYATNGEELKLRDFVQKLGYRDAGGMDPAATLMRP